MEINIKKVLCHLRQLEHCQIRTEAGRSEFCFHILRAKHELNKAIARVIIEAFAECLDKSY